MYARGCTAVGVDEICRQAGVHKGSFYHFFPSKQALILAVLLKEVPLSDVAGMVARGEAVLPDAVLPGVVVADPAGDVDTANSQKALTSAPAEH